MFGYQVRLSKFLFSVEGVEAGSAASGGFLDLDF